MSIGTDEKLNSTDLAMALMENKLKRKQLSPVLSTNNYILRK